MLGKRSSAESEKTIERKFASVVKKLGGLTIKMYAVSFTGLPDRLCLLPEGVVFFAEIKSTGKKPTKVQKLVHEKIRKLGFKVFVIDSTKTLVETFDEAIK